MLRNKTILKSILTIAFVGALSFGAFAQGTITNTVTRTSSDQVDRNAANDTGRVSFTVSSLIDLAVDISVAAGPYYTNDSYLYTVVVNNNGPSTGTNIIDTVILPTGLTASNISVGQGSYTTNGDTIFWAIGTLANGANTTMTYDGTPTIASATAVSYDTYTRVAGAEYESTYANNYDNVLISTTPSSDVQDEKFVANVNGSSFYYPGDTVEYTFVFTNNGPDPSTNHVDTDQLPASLTYVSGTATFVSGTGGATGSVSNSGSTFTFTSQIPVGQSVTYKLRAKIN